MIRALLGGQLWESAVLNEANSGFSLGCVYYCVGF